MSTDATQQETRDATDVETDDVAAVPDTDEDDQEVVEVDHRSSRLTRVISLVAIVVGIALTAPFAALALPFALSGLAIVGGSLFVFDSRGWLSGGVALVLVGQIIAGGFQAVPVELMVIGVSAVILGWDVGQYGIDIGRQLGRQASTQKVELTHTAFSLSVLTVGSGFVYGVYQLSGTGRPASAAALSLMGVILFLWMYRR